jgi:hypothetical protein
MITDRLSDLQFLVLACCYLVPASGAVLVIAVRPFRDWLTDLTDRGGFR